MVLCGRPVGGAPDGRLAAGKGVLDKTHVSHLCAFTDGVLRFSEAEAGAATPEAVRPGRDSSPVSAFFLLSMVLTSTMDMMASVH